MPKNTENTFNDRGFYFFYTEVYPVGVENVMSDRQLREPLSKFLRPHWVTWRNAGIPSINRNDRTRHRFRPVLVPLGTNTFKTDLEIQDPEYVNQLYNDVIEWVSENRTSDWITYLYGNILWKRTWCSITLLGTNKKKLSG